MRAGVPIASIYQSAQGFLESNRPQLKGFLSANLGFGMGLEFRESEFVLNAKNAKTLAPGQVYNLAVGLQDLKDDKGKPYALLIADTIQITADGAAAKLLTGDDLKSLSQVSYAVKSEQEQRDARKSRAAQVASEESSSAGMTGRRNTRLRTQQKVDEAAERRRREHQRELARLRLLEAKEVYASAGDGSGSSKNGLELQKFESYKKDSAWPRDLPRPNRVYVDERNESIILPVNGYPVPFHIATIKNVSKSEEAGAFLLRINFVTPGRAFGRKDASTTAFMDPQGHFIRSLTVKSKDGAHVQDVMKRITDLRKSYTAKETARKEMSDLVEQASLIEVQGRRPTRLAEVHIRPALEGQGRKLPGDVEIHQNGLRYRMQLKGDQRVDILFSNIKHLFFQPCDHEMAVIIHIHLKTPIMLGKKKTKDIQFYREALESHVDDTGGARRRRPAYGDEDEIAQEREERRKRQAANDEFQGFAEKIVESAPKDCELELEVPFRDLGFDGVPGRQNVLLQPTTECLVFLSEPPYLIVTLREVEIAYLERVMFGLKNFDLVFIFKDHSRPPVHVTSIPMSSLEAVKDWLDSMDVLFAESTVNFNWTNIMKTVVDDPVGFYDMGGWSYLQADGGAGSDAEGGAGSDDEDAEAESSEYEPDEDEDEEFEDDEDDDDEEFDEDEEDDEEEEDYSDEDDDEDEDEDEDDAPDWDELEEEARREDARRERDSSSKKRAPPTKSSSSSKRR